MADVEVTVSPVPDLLVENGLKLKNAARGVYFDTSTSISGAVGEIDFIGESIKRFTVTGDLTGSFSGFTNHPTLDADNQQVILTVIFFQDTTGGHSLSLETLFSNAFEMLGTPLTDESPEGITVVDIVARRFGGVTTYTANFSPTFDAGQVVGGVLDQSVLPTATDVVAGITTLSPGSGAAAKGDHTHLTPLPSRITIVMSGGGAIPNGDYPLVDMPSGGSIIRLTGMRAVAASGSPTATVSVKIAGVIVTGTGVGITSTASADADATGLNAFVSRQVISLNVAAVAGSPTLIEGFMHYSLESDPWAV